jgi:hypothetical protein
LLALFASLVEWLVVLSGGNPVHLSNMHLILSRYAGIYFLPDSRLRGNDKLTNEVINESTHQMGRTGFFFG